MLKNRERFSFYFCDSDNFEELRIPKKYSEYLIRDSDAVKISNNLIFMYSIEAGLNIFKIKVNRNGKRSLEHSLQQDTCFKEFFNSNREKNMRVNAVSLNIKANTIAIAYRKGLYHTSETEFREWNYLKKELDRYNLSLIFENVKEIRCLKHNSDYSKLLIADKENVIIYTNTLYKDV